MKRTAVLVNTTRGPVVDEERSSTRFAEGEIAGAALDVYEREPDVHHGLLELENVVLAPHLGSATAEAREAMGMLASTASAPSCSRTAVPRTLSIRTPGRPAYEPDSGAGRADRGCAGARA